MGATVGTNYSLKYISLLVLTIQTTTLVMLLRISRTTSSHEPRYVSSTAIVVSEALKILVCLVILFHENGSIKSLLNTINGEVLQKPKETSKLIVPAALYTIQNNLLFLALSNLDAATYQVTYQLKILTTAVFSVSMLRKRLAINQWLSLFLLMIGVAMVQWPDDNEDMVAENAKTESSRLVGLLAVLASCFSSGYSGVYFEKLVKHTNQSLWVRNIQLAIFGFLLAVGAVLIQDKQAVQVGGFFQGYNTLTWLVILLQAFGGLIVAIVMKYADNILKGFATSISIVLSTICSYYLLDDFAPSLSFFFGASIVISATLLYSC